MRQYLEDALVMLYKIADSGEREVYDAGWYVFEVEHFYGVDTHLSRFLQKVFPNREPGPLTSRGGYRNRTYVVNQEKLARVIAAVEAALAREAAAELTSLYETSDWKNLERTTIDGSAVAGLLCGDWVDQGDGTSALDVTAEHRALAQGVLTHGANS